MRRCTACNAPSRGHSRCAKCRKVKPSVPTAERNYEIAARLLEGEKMTALGREYGISRERIRQLAKKFGVTGEDSMAARMVEWRCEVCGKEELRRPGIAHAPTCSHACLGIRQRGPRNGGRTMPDGRGASLQQGRWRTHRKEGSVNAARHIAQLMLGRKLGRREWVVLIDGNEDNLDPSNIGVTDPKNVVARRDGKPWTYTPLLSMAKNDGAA